MDIFPLISPRENQYQQYQCTFSDTVNYRSVWYQTGYDLTVKNNNISPRENQYQQYQCTFSDTGKISPRENQYQQYQCTFSDTVNYLSSVTSNTLPLKIIRSVLKVLTYIITSITGHHTLCDNLSQPSKQSLFYIFNFINRYIHWKVTLNDSQYLWSYLKKILIKLVNAT